MAEIIEACPVCGGRGVLRSDDAGAVVCLLCRGTGMVCTVVVHPAALQPLQRGKGKIQNTWSKEWRDG